MSSKRQGNHWRRDSPRRTTQQAASRTAATWPPRAPGHARRRRPGWLTWLARGALLVVLLGHGLPGLAADSEVVLIAHPQLAIDAIPRDTVRAIFAMRQRTWPEGQAVHVTVLPDDHPVHARFAKGLLDVYPHQLRLAWDRMIFSGTGQAPDRVASQAAMLEQVATTPGGLGYVERGYLDDSVHVLPLAK